MTKMNGIIIENDRFRLELSSNCVAESLICKENGEECLAKGNEMALFSLTEERPYNNEIKLAYPNKKTTFQANRVRREENKLLCRSLRLIPVEDLLWKTSIHLEVNIRSTLFARVMRLTCQVNHRINTFQWMVVVIVRRQLIP